MKRNVKTIRWFLPFLVMALVCTEGEPTEQAEAGGDKVQVQENPNSITLSNGIISITLNKKTAQLTSLKAGSKGELLGGGGRGYYDMTAGRVDLSGPSFRIVRTEDDVAEVAFTKVIGGYTNEVHYALRKGEKGLHVFAIHRYAKGTNTPFPEESRFVLRVDPKLFTYAFTSEKKHGLFPLPAAIKAAKAVMDATYLLLDGLLYSKYDWVDAVVFLTSPCKEWQLQFKDYIFTTQADKEGKFLIKNIRPGTYTLYAYAPGIIGEYRKDNVTVKASGEVDFGTIDWTQPKHGKTLWQVGTPDRLAGEFRHGDEPRAYGLWANYTKDFPDGVNFIIGKSKERTDWNFAQFPGSTWKIQFDLSKQPTGKATLTLAIAGVSGNSSVTVLVNGARVVTLKYDNDSSVPRSGNQAGRYRLSYVPFDAGLLRPGQNTVSLQMGGALFKSGGVNLRPSAAIMYDCVRLEVKEGP